MEIINPGPPGNFFSTLLKCHLYYSAVSSRLWDPGGRDLFYSHLYAASRFGLVQSPPVSARAAGDPGSIPGSGRSPGEGNGSPLQYSCLRNPMDGGAWWVTVHGIAESEVTERLSMHTQGFSKGMLRKLLLWMWDWCPQGLFVPAESSSMKIWQMENLISLSLICGWLCNIISLRVVSLWPYCEMK